MLLPRSNSFGAVLLSGGPDDQPTNDYGGLITPAQNAYGNYNMVMNANYLTDDAYEIWINIQKVGISGVARDCLVTIGVDPAGSTSYVDTIEHLVAACAGPNIGSMAPGVCYRFPLRIKKNSTIGAKASVNSADLTGIRVWAQLFCRPTRPDLIRVGSFVRAFGVNTAASCGTTVTAGQAAKGDYVELGTLAEPLWAWEYGHGVNDDIMANGVVHHDVALGDATNKRIVLADGRISYTVGEVIEKRASLAYGQGAVGDKVYGRMQCSTTPNSNLSMAAYGVGG